MLGAAAISWASRGIGDNHLGLKRELTRAVDPIASFLDEIDDQRE